MEKKIEREFWIYMVKEMISNKPIQICLNNKKKITPTMGSLLFFRLLATTLKTHFRWILILFFFYWKTNHKSDDDFNKNQQKKKSEFKLIFIL